MRKILKLSFDADMSVMETEMLHGASLEDEILKTLNEIEEKYELPCPEVDSIEDLEEYDEDELAGFFYEAPEKRSTGLIEAAIGCREDPDDYGYMVSFKWVVLEE